MRSDAANQEPGPRRPTDRAFVIQFEPTQGARARFRGRVELVATGEAMRFRSQKQLVAFLTRVLSEPVRISWSLVLVAGLASSAQAVDGVLEINQVCAAGPGCFAGDAPGFPVELGPGSYRLTGDLTPPDQDTHVIEISGMGVSLDLNGFGIQGTNTFSPGGSCSAPGTGSGVASSADVVSISNGHIRGMGSNGIVLTGVNHRIEQVTAEQNCGSGITPGDSSLVIDSVARRNGGHGIGMFFLSGYVARVSNSVAELNGSSGIAGQSLLVEGYSANSNSNGINQVGGLVTDSTASANGSTGIQQGGAGALVLRSSANGNGLGGISAFGVDGVGFITANGNGAPNIGGPRLVACVVAGGVQSCP